MPSKQMKIISPCVKTILKSLKDSRASITVNESHTKIKKSLSGSLVTTPPPERVKQNSEQSSPDEDSSESEDSVNELPSPQKSS